MMPASVNSLDQNQLDFICCGDFIELRKATRRDITRDTAKAKNAFASSQLISAAKNALLRFGQKKTAIADGKVWGNFFGSVS
ncbi:hypothetical protein [Lacticaseibacillus sp. N501-2]|uniref:hypothetical protein n=1 Tax=Lacticaseibacillus salsurae TaxID=3367729 RepID=UPI0038B3C75D